MSSQELKVEAAHVEDVTTDELDDPHKAAFVNNPDSPEKLTLSVVFSVLFLALSFTGPLSFGFILPTSIITQIGTDLGDTTSISWIPSGWSVAASASFCIAGSLSDIFGRRYIMLSGNVLAIIGAICSATAQTTNVVIAGTTLIGFGCGMVFVAYAGIPELLPNKWRGAGLAVTEFMMVVPWNFFAVLIGLKFVETATWRWCYYSGIIYGVVSTVGVFVFYFPPTRPKHDYEKSRWQQVKEVDYLGFALYMAGITLCLVGLSWAGSAAHPWRGTSVIAPIVVGGVLIILLFLYDFRFAKQPIFPYRLFRRVREYTVLLILIFVAGMMFHATTTLLPQGSLYLFTNDPTEIGVMSLPGGAGQFVGGVVLPALVHKMKHTRAQIVVALSLQTIFCALFVVAVPNNRAAWMAFQFFVQGVFGWITLNCYVIAGLHVHQTDLGIASALIGTFRSGGGSVGSAIFSTIFNSVSSQQVKEQVTAAALQAGFDSKNLAILIPATIKNAVGTVGAFSHVPGITPAVEAAAAQALKNAYADALKKVFLITIPFNVVAVIAALFIKDVSKYFTNHVAIHLEKDILAPQLETNTNQKEMDTDP